MTDDVPVHGGQLHPIAERFGVHVETLIDFSANMNPDGPPAAVLDSLRASLEDPAVITTYPDIDNAELKDAISRFVGVAPHAISVANGFVPLLESALRTLRVKRCLLPVPAFLEYRRTLERLGVEIIPHILKQDCDFQYSTEMLLAGNHDAILLANPQNPSGTLTRRKEMLSFVEAAASQRIRILLDEAFIDYAPAESLATEATRLPNLIVFRSVTKFLGVPGLRVAYALAMETATRELMRDLAPWPITTLAGRAVAAGLADTPFSARTRQLNEQRRQDLRLKMESLGVHTYPSAANFLLLRLLPDTDANSLWGRLIADHATVLRDCSNYEELSPGHLRCAVRNDKDNLYLFRSIRSALVASTHL